jgi:hypothetical protein
VAGIWALAATAIAVFALIEANKEDDTARTQAAGELGRVQRALNDRIDELESRIDELPTRAHRRACAAAAARAVRARNRFHRAIDSGASSRRGRCGR